MQRHVTGATANPRDNDCYRSALMLTVPYPVAMKPRRAPALTAQHTHVAQCERVGRRGIGQGREGLAWQNAE